MLTAIDARALGLTKFTVRFLVDGTEVETTTYGRSFADAELHGRRALAACFAGDLVFCEAVPHIGLE